MDDFENFMKDAGDYSLSINTANSEVEQLMVSDVLFHTPIISLALMVIAYKKRNLTTSDMPNWVGSVLSNSFWTTKKINRKLEWSLVMRNRFADALIFLEANKLLKVKGTKRIIEITDEGKKFVTKNQRNTDKLGQLMRGFKVSVSEVESKGLSLL